MSEFPALPYCCDHSVQMSKKASVATAANKKAKSSYFSVFFASLRVVLDVEVSVIHCYLQRILDEDSRDHSEHRDDRQRDEHNVDQLVCRRVSAGEAQSRLPVTDWKRAWTASQSEP